MTKTIKVGTIYVEVPDNSPLLSIAPGHSRPVLRAELATEKIDPDPIPEVRIYQPNDFFRASVDRVEVLGNLEKVDKPWVKRTFFVFFLLIPFAIGEMFAVSALLNGARSLNWSAFYFVNILTLLVCSPFIAIWYRTKRREYERVKLLSASRRAA